MTPAPTLSATFLVLSTVVLESGSENGAEMLTEFSTVSVVIALLALTLVVAIGFGVFLFGFVRLIARR